AAVPPACRAALISVGGTAPGQLAIRRRSAAAITSGSTDGDTTKRAPASTLRSTSAAVSTVPAPTSTSGGTREASRSTTSRAPFVVSVSSRLRIPARSEEHTSELQSRENLVCRLLLEKKKKLITSGQRR